MNINEFLVARITEDEAAARAIPDGSWEVGENPDYGFEEGIWDNSEPVNEIVCMRNYPEDGQDWPVGRHIVRHDPARVLAECEAKRAIIKQVSDVAWGGYAVRDVILRHLAGAYADHADFELEWA